jgi:hypothetical protein
MPRCGCCCENVFVVGLATYIGPALSCSYPPPDIGRGGEWECREIYNTSPPFNLQEVRCYYRGTCTDCNQDIDPSLSSENSIIQNSCFQPGFDGGANFFACCEGCCDDGVEEFAETYYDCVGFNNAFLGLPASTNTWTADPCEDPEITYDPYLCEPGEAP